MVREPNVFMRENVCRLSALPRILPTPGELSARMEIVEDDRNIFVPFSGNGTTVFAALEDVMVNQNILVHKKTRRSGPFCQTIS
jgi:hypothetical protein